MCYPKIGLEVNLGGVEGKGEGVLSLGVNGGGKSLIATYPENFVLISQLDFYRCYIKWTNILIGSANP